MKFSLTTTALAGTLAFVLGFAAPALADIKIGATLSETGPASFLGDPEAKTLKMLVEDLDPQAINEATAQDGGLGGLIGSRKAKMWEAYVARWDAKTAPYENGLIDAFMIYFAECYDRGGK